VGSAHQAFTDINVFFEKGTECIHVTREDINRVVSEKFGRCCFAMGAHFTRKPHRIFLSANEIRLAEVDKSVLSAAWAEVSWKGIVKVTVSRALTFMVHDQVQLVDVLSLFRS
jgi:hypothetical protein